MNFNLLLTTKPSVVKFKVEGNATLTGKDEEINKVLEVDPEMKVPYVFQKVYQKAFEAMYLLSTILKSPPPPPNLLMPKTEMVPTESGDVEQKVGEATAEEGVERRVEESTAMEGAVTEGSETTTGDIDVEPRTGGERTEERIEERTEEAPSTRG